MRTIRIAFLASASVLLSIESGDEVIAEQGSQAVKSSVAQTTARKQVTTEISYPQVYATPDGETHFREVRVPLALTATAAPAQPVAQSELQSATTIRHAVLPSGWGIYDRDHNILHNASSARYVTIRSGVMWIKTSDGEARRFQRGDVVEVLDVAPSRGHVTWVDGGEPVTQLYSNHP